MERKYFCMIVMSLQKTITGNSFIGFQIFHLNIKNHTNKQKIISANIKMQYILQLKLYISEYIDMLSTKSIK